MIMASDPSIDHSILFISYHFPPDAAVGAKRIAKLAGFLKDGGYKVGVLTVKAKYFERNDYSLCDDELEVYRTSMLPSARLLYLRIKKILGRVRNSGTDGVSASEYAPEMNDEGSSGPLGWIKRAILSIIWLPDYFQGWVPFGFTRCLRLRKKYNFTNLSCIIW